MSKFAHVHDYVIDPKTFQPVCRICNKLWGAITDAASAEELENWIEEEKARHEPREAYDRAMRGIKCQ
jgi:hypothetical protein